jgi:ribonuclease III
MKTPSPLEEALGYTFRRSGLLEQALTHPSRKHESSSIQKDNQRLEFLGDAALGMAVADFLYRTYPAEDEGWMTTMRARVTSTRALADLARTLDLGASLQLGRGEEMSGGGGRDSNLADAMEAVFGAAYLDGGFKAVKTIINRHLRPLLEDQAVNAHEENPKGVLQEWCQRVLRHNPTYTCISMEGPHHARRYTMEVQIGEALVFRGEGDNKREAERVAASRALAQIAEQDASASGRITASPPN